jgi:hypothetical protein
MLTGSRIEEIRNELTQVAQAVPSGQELMQAMVNLLHERMLK